MAGKKTIRDTGRDDDQAHWRKLAGTVTPLRRNRYRPGVAGRTGLVPDPAVREESPGADAPARPGRGGGHVPPGPAARGAPAGPPGPPGPINLDNRGFGGISRADAQRVKSGRARIDDRIDLHGMALHQAVQALRGFVQTAAGRGDRTLLVVTGKGRGGMGVIRQHLPKWLEDPPLRGLVLAFGQAQPRDGGSGAFYVRLRGR